MKYSIERIRKIRKTAVELNLIGADKLEKLTDEEIISMANGIGSANMPNVLRNAITKLHPSLEIPAVIHDISWTMSDGSKEWFLKSNEEFEQNGIIMAKHLHAWYSPLRYLAIHKARQFRKILDEFGESAYNTCHK